MDQSKVSTYGARLKLSKKQVQRNSGGGGKNWKVIFCVLPFQFSSFKVLIIALVCISPFLEWKPRKQ